MTPYYINSSRTQVEDQTRDWTNGIFLHTGSILRSSVVSPMGEITKASFPKEASNFEKDLSHIAGKPVNMNFPYSDMSKMENFDLAMAKTTTFWHLSGVVP